MSSGFKSGGPRGGRGGESKFRTDSDISASRTGRERKLQRWDEQDAATAPSNVDLSSLGTPAEVGKWDQFAANREKFGIESTYDERLYTTEIDTSHPEYAERERRAAQIAREIESQSHGGNAHIAEERGLVVDDSQMDEEDRYSGVQRPNGFVANEARRSMASPTYLRERERGDRLEDLRRFSQDYRVQSPVPPDLLPILGKKSKSAAAKENKMNQAQKQAQNQSQAPPSNKSLEKQSEKQAEKPVSKAPNSASSESTKEQKPKSKFGAFNFSASAAKSASFKSSFSPQPFSPSPRQPSFSPHPVPMQPVASASPLASVSPSMTPGLPYGMLPPQQGFAPGMPMPMIPPMRPPSTGPAAGVSPGSASPDPVEIRPLGASFDFFAQLAAKGESAPKPFATPPSWTTISDVSYVDQFTVSSPRAPPMMPSFGFMIPQF